MNWSLQGRGFWCSAHQREIPLVPVNRQTRNRMNFLLMWRREQCSHRQVIGWVIQGVHFHVSSLEHVVNPWSPFACNLDDPSGARWFAFTVLISRGPSAWTRASETRTVLGNTKSTTCLAQDLISREMQSWTWIDFNREKKLNYEWAIQFRFSTSIQYRFVTTWVI